MVESKCSFVVAGKPVSYFEDKVDVAEASDGRFDGLILQLRLLKRDQPQQRSSRSIDITLTSTELFYTAKQKQKSHKTSKTI